MLKKIFALSLALALFGCGTVNAQSYGYGSALPGCHEEYRTVYDSFYGSRTVTTTVCSSYNSYRHYDYDNGSRDVGMFLFGTILGAAVGSQFNNNGHRHYRSQGNYNRHNYGRHYNWRHNR